MTDHGQESASTRSSRSRSSSSSIGSSYRLESVNTDNSEMNHEEMVAPSLGIEELEGRIHPYEGPLEYKAVGGLGALKGWKKRWFRVAGGEQIS